jgi:homocysteine S-methyltransferase
MRNDAAFSITIEVVPPVGSDPELLLTALENVSTLPFDGFSVATNPVAKPRMSAFALSVLIQQRTPMPVTLHCTTRDHNRLSLQGLLWGARALGIDTVLVATGDYIALGAGAKTSFVRDLNVYELVKMAREANMHTGVVLDPRPESDGLAFEIQRLEDKVKAGAQFVVTQPVYDEDNARILYDATKHLDIPVVLGILPLRTARHARFLHYKVSGIAVPKAIRERMRQSKNPIVEGIAGAREMLDIAREWFGGACIMPPFDHYEMLHDIL